jgi:hypothetical protein
MMSAETEVPSSDCQPSHVRAAGIPYAPCARDARTTLRRPGTSYANGALRASCLPAARAYLTKATAYITHLRPSDASSVHTV